MPDTTLILIVFLVLLAIGAALAGPLARAPLAGADTPSAPTSPSVAIGTVRSVSDLVTVDVESVSGERFVGRLRAREGGDGGTPGLRPGVVLLVAFDPAERDRLVLADDMVAVRAAFDRMLLRKGLVTAAELALIRTGIRCRGIVTGMRATGGAREDFREVELDLMVSRPEGGQFPAHEVTLVPESALAEVAPGSVVDAYYRRGDESTVAVCVPPR